MEAVVDRNAEPRIHHGIGGIGVVGDEVRFGSRSVAREKIVDIGVVVHARIDEGLFRDVFGRHRIAACKGMSRREPGDEFRFHQREEVPVIGMLRKKRAVEGAVLQARDEFLVGAFNGGERNRRIGVGKVLEEGRQPRR